MGEGHDCWEVERDSSWTTQRKERFFNEIKESTHCDSNWYDGSPGWLGRQIPHFDDDAPALLGFDEDINWACSGSNGLDHAAACVQHNYNILALFGNHIPYNLCRNLEWQVCAAQGKLPGQSDAGINFATVPSSIDPNDDDGHGLGMCQGFVEPGRGRVGYATVDIYFLEVCIYNQICSNGEELFALDELEDWQCQYDTARFDELQRLLTSPYSDAGEDVCWRG